MLLEEINIEKLLPQAHPFIMIDQVVDFKPNTSLTAVKNVTANEWYFTHAGQHVPETLLIEAAAQTAILFARMHEPNPSGNFRVVLGKICAEFTARAGIGDQVVFRTSGFKMMKGGGYVDIEMSVSGQTAGRVNIFYSLKEHRSYG